MFFLRVHFSPLNSLFCKLQALTYIIYIRKGNPDRTEPIKVVVTGGVISVMHLRNRTTTRNIDFFAEDPAVLEEVFAAKRATHMKLGHYPSNWINAGMLAFVSNVPDCDKLFSHSIEQGGTIYQCDVLTVYIAD
jgi:hypothetical protein